jgi:hypothetical protein
MALFHNYDPQRVVGSFRGIPFLAYMDGTFLSVARTEDAFTPQVGATGDVTRVRSRDRSGTVTLTLQAASPSNTLLSAVAVEDELFGTGFGPLMIKDLNGDTLVQAEVAWIQKLPDTEFSDEASGREWVFACAELFMHVGSGTIL